MFAASSGHAILLFFFFILFFLHPLFRDFRGKLALVVL